MTARAWLAIALSGAGTFAMRLSFIGAASRLATVPPPVRRVLRQIPPAALAALVVPALIRPEVDLDLTHPRVFAGAVAALIAWRTRNAAVTLVVGMSLLALLERL